ncbi:MAG: hypothetical protein H6608_03380 [Flavobacteriales bacterium]|nr:hypothetical protein [Bacteroidota bacterium]MCB9240147.1 hypothetical protein [Flavobacteriales bacterium]
MNTLIKIQQMTRSAFFVLACLSFGIAAQSQAPKAPQFPDHSTSYSTAIGIRGGYTGGITFKQRFGANAVEGIADIWQNGITGRILLEKNVSAGIGGLNWYYGAGGHVSITDANWQNEQNFRRYPYRNPDSGLGLGVDGIIGIEYKIPPIPFAISLDVLPQIEVRTNGHVWGSVNPGLGIKVVF